MEGDKDGGEKPKEKDSSNKKKESFNYDYKGVEFVDAKGKPAGEFDGIDMVKKTFIEDKSAKGLSILNPRTGKPQQTPRKWADKQIYEKSINRIENMKTAISTRATKDGSKKYPSIEEIKDFKSLHFKIDADTPELRKAVEDQLTKLRNQYSSWSFSVQFG